MVARLALVVTIPLIAVVFGSAPPARRIANRDAPGTTDRQRIPVNQSDRAIPNENRAAAGQLSNGMLNLNLEARAVNWFPEDTSGPAVPVYAFAEPGKSAMVPAPLIRVPVGTEMRVSIHNTLAHPLTVRGFFPRASAALESPTIQLTAGSEIQQWRAVAKDRADLAAHQATLRPAHIVVHPGETYDFEVIRPRADTLTLMVISIASLADRDAARARGLVGAQLPRIMTPIPVIVR